MYNTNKYVDFSFLAILGLFIASTVYSHFAEGFDFTVNNYLAFTSWLLVLLLRVLKYQKSYGLFFLMLLLASFEVINFTIGKDTLNIGHGVENTIHIPFNPYLFLLLIVYSVINGKLVLRGIGVLLRGNDKEVEEKRAKMVSFYYKKFNTFNADELNNAFSNIKEYPEEAQIALANIRAEKEVV